MAVISVSVLVFVFEGEFERQLCLQNPLAAHLGFFFFLTTFPSVCVCVYVNITYPQKTLHFKHKVFRHSVIKNAKYELSNAHCCV